MKRSLSTRLLALAGLLALMGAAPLAAQTYPVDVHIEAYDRQGLLRDISDVIAKDRLERVMRMEANRMTNLVLTEHEIATVHYWLGEFQKAEAVLEDGMRRAGDDVVRPHGHPREGVRAQRVRRRRGRR